MGYSFVSKKTVGAKAVSEVWAMQLPRGDLVCPLDDDGTDVFLAWPTEEQARQGLNEQLKKWNFGDEPPVVVKLFPKEPTP